MRLPVGGEEPSGLIRTSCDDHTGVVVWGKGLDHVMDQTVEQGSMLVEMKKTFLMPSVSLILRLRVYLLLLGRSVFVKSFIVLKRQQPLVIYYV